MDRARDPGSGARSALARWLKPPRTLRPTRAGWLFLLLTFGVGFAALNTGNNLLYLVVSLMLAFLVLSGVLSESALRGISVRRRLPREMFAGQEARIALEIANEQSRVPAFAVVVQEVGGGRAFVLRIPPRCSEVRRYRFVPPRRGEHRFTGFRVSTRFPFGLFLKSMEIEASETALVYPAVDRVTVPPEFGATRDTGETVTGARGRGAVVTGLRSWVAGDPVRRIHWPASLRRRELLARDVESEHQAEVEVRLRTGGQASGERFENAVRWAASEVVAFLDAGRHVALRSCETYIQPDAGDHHRARLLGFLARVEPT